ncbi:helix-turn-helix transcriptional regulator [Virgibacillus alimentarius]|uniref:Transcriptional regulator with XRE-family HTH domain n=1 Tax=Virgibacillus alimentarius TaxID=698769 RepID=A0ABS4SA45_9BACI|nr:helix-turn-helix transcriptional regulator [Virgibacillus alimentarius]MBP2257749.1 transcriptional regulator with XRE-family HTH domain [Virgibacillus alimentarius]
MGDAFGDKLKRLREESGMSQEALAKELNVSRQAVYKWESNKGYPDIENLIQMSDLFAVTIDELIRSDKKLQNKMKMDDVESLAFSDPGFYIGIVLVLLGVTIFDDTLSYTMTIIGLLTILFFTDILRSFQSMFKKYIKIACASSFECTCYFYAPLSF